MQRLGMQEFHEEAEYLKTLFPALDKIEGIIVKLDTEGGFDNYQEKIGNPMEENTLIIGDQDNNVLLFFNCSNKSHNTQIFQGVTVFNKYNYDKESIIHKRRDPVDVPLHLEKYIFDFASNSLVVPLRSLEVREPIEIFLKNNYIRGGMMPLKEMKQHPEWKKEYRKNIDIKKVQICKFCNKKSLKGCCSNYSSVNRSMLTMVIGWSKK